MPRQSSTRAGFRTNNLDPNARHCMASAVAGFMRTFGIDEPMGCYDDLEKADAFVLWGANMAEMHPILWSRLTDRKLTHKDCEVHVLSTFEHRSFELADNGMIFAPQSDLAILNYICNYIIQNNAVNTDFVTKHTAFTRTVEDIGYGLRPTHELEVKAKNASHKAGKDGAVDPAGMSDITFEQFKELVSKYTLEYTAKLSGVEPAKLERMAKLYADPKKKIVSYWTMGFNQHTRGTWVNNLIYNVHLLTGKISEPGNGPFSLTGQPSACGTAREVGTFAHRLPADMVVTNPAHRAMTEKIWRLPEGTLPGNIGYHAVVQHRMLKDGKLNAYWGPMHEQHADRAEHERRGLSRLSQSRQLHRRLRSLSNRHRTRGRSHSADRHVDGKGRRLRQRRTPHPVLAPASQGTGRSALRSLADGRVLEVLQDRGSMAGGADREEARSARQDALRTCSTPTAPVNKFPVSDTQKGFDNDESSSFGFYLQKGPLRGIRRLRSRQGARSRTVRSLSPGTRPALAGRRQQGNAVGASAKVTTAT